jgi:hypothetical protein
LESLYFRRNIPPTISCWCCECLVVARVTKLGEFSPIGWLCTLASFFNYRSSRILSSCHNGWGPWGAGCPYQINYQKSRAWVVANFFPKYFSIRGTNIMAIIFGSFLTNFRQFSWNSTFCIELNWVAPLLKHFLHLSRTS